MTADDKYSLLNRDNLKQPIHMHWSQKGKKISQYSCAFLKSSLNFENFQKKMTLFPKLQAPKKVLG